EPKTPQHATRARCLHITGQSIRWRTRTGIASTITRTMRFLVLLIFALAAVAQDASQLFQKQCSVCHGDGHGTERGPNLTDSRRLRTRSVDELRGLVRNGIPARGMPAFNLPPAELDSITLLLRSWNAPASESNPPGNR